MLPTNLRNILYVDDEPSNLIVFEAAFEEHFQVFIAESAREALQIVEKHPIPVVVADQRMPEMTGIQLFQILRRQFPQIQRIVLSAFTSPEALIDAINEGQIFQFVHKPWEFAELLNVIRRALDAHDMLVENSLLRKQLAQSERCAILGQSAARITHEIGNQLQLLPLVETIEDNYSNDPLLLELAQTARRTHQNLIDLVAEIRDFVKSEDSSLKLQPISVAESIRDLLGFLKFHPAIASDVLTVTLEKDGQISGHRLKLQQVLINLLRNASDAIEDRPGGKIQLTTQIQDQSMKIAIVDNGCGIPEDQRNKIWDPYFTTKSKTGTGLGLDVVRSIVTAFGGQIVCQSVKDIGTTFEMIFPLLSSPDEPRLETSFGESRFAVSEHSESSRCHPGTRLRPSS